MTRVVNSILLGIFKEIKHSGMNLLQIYLNS